MIAIACFFAGRNWDTLYGKDHIRLRVGETTTLSPQGTIARVSVGNPDVCDVNVFSSSSIQLIGKSKGLTTIETWNDPNQTPTKHTVIVRR